MNDSISRQAAADELIAMQEHIESRMSVVGTTAYEMAIEALREPEIIHCKDCRHGVDYYHEGDCYCTNPKWGLMYFGGSWEFYCADAEKRGDKE